jgi:peptidoglycan/LPS O-acetylase OafA/YrhL
LRYVPALDGLRALAVMMVFLFHTSLVPGGWVGVDIFFVLSGYLITSVLLTEYERTGVISLRHFYSAALTGCCLR